MNEDPGTKKKAYVSFGLRVQAPDSPAIVDSHKSVGSGQLPAIPTPQANPPAVVV